MGICIELGQMTHTCTLHICTRTHTNTLLPKRHPPTLFVCECVRVRKFWLFAFEINRKIRTKARSVLFMIKFN